MEDKYDENKDSEMIKKTDDIPVIIDGELNISGMRKNDLVDKPKKEEHLPQKRFTIMDVLLTLAGIALIIYGIDSFINKDENKEPVKENKPIVEKETIHINDIVNYFTLPLNQELTIYDTSDFKLMLNGLTPDMMSDNAKLSLATRITNQHTKDDKTYIDEQELDKSMKKLFGDITYNKQAFSYGVNQYTYNQETKKYYLMNNNVSQNYDYNKINYVKTDEKDNTLIIKEYVAYTMKDNSSSFTINNKPLDIIIDNNNIQKNINYLSYYEYVLEKVEDEYHLQVIYIK